MEINIVHLLWIVPLCGFICYLVFMVGWYKHWFLLLLALPVHAQFKSENSISLNDVGGNTELKTYVLQTSNKWSILKNSFRLIGKYNYGESKQIRNSESWEGTARYDRNIFRKLSLYLGEKVEANRYSGIDRRYNYDIGTKYIFSQSDGRSFFAEIGYRYTIEKPRNSLLMDYKDSKGRGYSEIEQKLNSIVSAKFWIEYLPNFTREEDELINLEPSLSVVLTSVLSLKSSYLWKYDSDPIPGKGKHDYQYFLTLIAKVGK